MLKLTWAHNSKHRLYSDNILQDSGPLSQQCLLRTITNIEDMRLEFIERDQTNSIAEERELQQAVMYDDDAFHVGRVYLPYSHVNSLSYWNKNLLDVQSRPYQSDLHSFMITITMNTWGGAGAVVFGYCDPEQLLPYHLQTTCFRPSG